MADREEDDPWSGEDANTVIPLLCLVRGWSRTRLGQEAGIDKGQMSHYESGKTTPRPERKRRLLEAARVPFPVVAGLSARLRLIRQATAGEAPAGSVPRTQGSATPESGFETALALAGRELAALRQRRLAPHAAVDEALARVEGLWERFQSLAPELRRPVLEASRSYRDWPFLVRLCEESANLAPHHPGEALELARLAVHAARRRLRPGDKPWRSRLEGYATAFEANAHRVAGNLKAADRAFAGAWQLWRDGADPVGRLSKARLLDLEASLRRDEGRFVTALARLAEARELAAPSEAGRLLVSKSAVLEGMGDYEGSLAALEQAAGAMEAERQPRNFFGLRYNQAKSLCQLGRAEAAARLLPEIRQLAERQRNDGDLLKTLWLEALVLAGLGQTAEAVAGLEQVCRDFRQRPLPYDFALAGLDLAFLYREQGRWAEIKHLAKEMVEIFEKEGVYREALAAVLLFQEAAVQQAVSVELIHRLQSYFKQARPGVPFDSRGS